jgi:hypothetical protein
MKILPIIDNVKLFSAKIILNIVVFLILGIIKSYTVSRDMIEYVKEKIDNPV